MIANEDRKIRNAIKFLRSGKATVIIKEHDPNKNNVFIYRRDNNSLIFAYNLTRASLSKRGDELHLLHTIIKNRIEWHQRFNNS